MAFLDDFTGAAGTRLTDRTGWVKLGIGTSLPELNGSGQLRTSVGDDVALAGQDTGNADHYVQATLLAGFAASGGFGYTQLQVRTTSRHDGYGVTYFGGNWMLVKDNSSAMQVVAGTFTPGAVLRIEALGSQITVKLNGATIISASYSDKLTNTGVGLLCAGPTGNDPVFDNYESGTLGGTAPPPPTPPTGVFTKVQADGDNVNIEIATTNNPTAGTVSLPVASTNPGGAVAQPAINLTFTTSKATATFPNVPAGSYGVPVANLSNGSSSPVAVTGGNGVTIIGMTEGAGTDVPPRPPVSPGGGRNRGRGRARKKR